ncbi:MAG: hypothetical protein IT381_20985 [Deltaproteobacteria bacterium]|nr:hypothetical protein [Deltaproteobacteria bacterium]
MLRRVSLVVLVFAAACGRDPESITHTQMPIVTQGNTPLPDAALNDPNRPSSVLPPTNTFEGTVAELHAFQNRKSGLPVTLPFVVVSANAGNGEKMYVNDPEVADFSGILVERCAKTDKVCKDSPPALGSNVKVVGTLFVNKDGGATIGKVTVSAASGDPIFLRQRGVPSSDVVPTKITGNEAIRGLPVFVADQDGEPSLFVVDNLEPEDDKNGNFPGDLEAKCGVANLQKPANATVSCCPAGVGPKYFSFIVREVSTGNKVAIQTGNYRDITFNAWPCSARDLAETLKVGDEFKVLGGIFDVSFGKASISPGSPTHYQLVRK